ncbi:MAG: hypothetical protein AAFZ52_14555 [Bacteroidota bacterium]
MGTLSVCVRAQVGADVDAEYVEWCVVDSLAPGQIERFTRIMHLPSRNIIDVALSGDLYQVRGTTIRCADYDLREAKREPSAPYGADFCECQYRMSQENHRVTEIRGGSDQDYTVEFHEVVRRQCSSESQGTVVARDTLSVQDAFQVDDRYEYQLQFVQNGDFVDKLNVRRYNAGSSIGFTTQIDLNPATVQASYPGLTLDPADFAYDGSNTVDIAAAYQQVLTEVLGIRQNSYTVVASGNSVFLRFQYLHLPTGAYAMLPSPEDNAYQLSGPVAANNSTGVTIYSHGLITNTSDFSEYCETINTRESAVYFTFDPLEPREIQPLVGVIPNVVTAASNPVATCEVEPEVCGRLAADPVYLVDSCLTVCSDVLNIPDHFPAANIDTTMAAQEYNSVSIWVTQGTVGITFGSGQRINYPAGWIGNWSAQEGKLLAAPISIDATDAEAIIQYVR